MAPVLTNLRADLVPPRQWALRKWFYAGPLWYYHRRGTDGRFIANEPFYERIDPELRSLCRMLHEAGLGTTPSCQGHFRPPRHFAQVWEQLRRDAEAITGRGLMVRDSETDDVFRFRNPQYTVPWRSFEGFLGEVMAHRGTGYLGIRIPPQREELREAFASLAGNTEQCELAFDEEVGRQLGEGVFYILLRPDDAARRAKMWRDITQQIRGLLKRELAALR